MFAGVDPEKALRKLRSLTLCSLGDEAADDTVGFGLVQERLALKDGDEVEQAIVNAVVDEFVDAKIDQEKETVFIERSMPRKFKDAQWQNIANKLYSWHNSIELVLNNFDAVRHHLQALNGGPNQGDQQEQDEEKE